MPIVISRTIMRKIRRREIRFHLGGQGRKIYIIRSYANGFRYCVKCARKYYMPDGLRCPFGHKLRSSPRCNDSRKMWLKRPEIKRIKLSDIRRAPPC